MNFPFHTIIKSLDMAPAVMSVDEILYYYTYKPALINLGTGSPSSISENRWIIRICMGIQRIRVKW